MRILQMSLLLLSAGIFDTIFSSNVIPTKEEQANLLYNVQEVFEQVKLLVEVEGNSTDDSVVSDINKIVQRAKDKLELLQELSLTKLSRDRNSVESLDARQSIRKFVQKATDDLKECVKTGSSDIKVNSKKLTDVTSDATQRGQEFLDSLYSCSRKNGLHVVSCYKDVIATDVSPVKKMLIGAVEAHKKNHLKTIEIRSEANNCVDAILAGCARKISDQLRGE